MKTRLAVFLARGCSVTARPSCRLPTYSGLRLQFCGCGCSCSLWLALLCPVQGIFCASNESALSSLYFHVGHDCRTACGSLQPVANAVVYESRRVY